METMYRESSRYVVSAAETRHYCYQHVDTWGKGSAVLSFGRLRVSPGLFQNSVSSILHPAPCLLVDVLVALLLHPISENHGDAQNEDEVDADDAKGRGEYLVQILVRKRRELADAAAFLRCNEGV
jgi:hypothetical protein